MQVAEAKGQGREPKGKGRARLQNRACGRRFLECPASFVFLSPHSQ